MKARALLHKGKLITIWNGDIDINIQINNFIEENLNTILDDIDYYEGGYFDIENENQFFEYEITICGDNGVMIFHTIIYNI